MLCLGPARWVALLGFVAACSASAAGDDGSPAGGAGGAPGAVAGSGGSPVAAPTIFYLDVSGKVMTADAEAPKPRTVVADAGRGPDGIAVDPTAGFIYWTNMGVPADDDGYLQRSNLDGTAVVTLVPAGGSYTPKQLKLDAAGGKLYWSDREGMRIQRANVDGSNVETLVTTGTGATDRRDQSRWCVGMALDVAGGWFYWTQKGPDDGGVGSIRRAHIVMPSGQTSGNRTDVEVLYAGLPEPIDIDLDLAAGLIYWADRGDDTINRAPIAIPGGRTAATRTDREILIRDVGEAIGIAVDPARGRLYYTGASGQLGRANLDGSAKAELTEAGAMTGIVIL
jgi:DNA-binding beta-propeller fold protein YncE